MQHSIISWDCCYRNFFYSALALADQQFDCDNFEVIYVEQRTRAASDAYNCGVGLPPLSEVVRALEDRINIRALYLGDGPDTPLHWGRAVNLGIHASSGRIVSVMDGDLLVDRDFLSALDHEHMKSPNIVANLHRRMVPRPLGVPQDRWTQQSVTFDSCLAACPDRDRPLPDTVQNYGPLISARREHWDAIGGYDEHRIWSSGLSRIGEDVTRRLEVQLDTRSYLLPDTVCVHPWHPAGFRRDTFSARRILSLQGDLIAWTRSTGVSDWRERRATAEVLYCENQRFVERVIGSEAADPSVTPTRLNRTRAWVSGAAAKVVKGEFRQLRGELTGAVRNMLSGGR